MKMTLHIDEHVLADVMTAHGIDTKTEAIDFALRELDRRTKLRAFQKEGLGLTPDELRAAVSDEEPEHPEEVPYTSIVAAPEMVFNAHLKKK